MSLASRILHSAVAVMAALPLVASAQGRITAHPEVRVLAKINPAVKKTLTGQVPQALSKAAIGSRLAASTRMDRMLLMLQPTGTQEAALHTLVDAQQDKNSPSFHKWLTPETYGQTFGVAQTDIDKVSAWLQDSGFTIDQIAASRRVIEFSGTAGQVESAFQTEMHSVTLEGEAHVSNTTEISVPEALAPVIRGIARLNNFAPKSNAKLTGKALLQRPVSVSTMSDGVTPEYGSSATGTHYVGPGDVATIFNATPLLNASTPLRGTGTSISVLGRTAINLGDIAAFRSLFGLPAKTPKVTLVGGDPGLNADDTEAYLDVEWAGAVAPDADINYIYSSPSLSGGDIDAAALYAVNNNIGDIISLSYGGCESRNGASATAFWNILWEQAAAQGQTAFISSGDSGAAGCDSSSATYATGGYGVNALGSSAYNVAVGGSMFVDYGPAQYWGTATAPPYATALSYIPEAALNQGRLTTTLLNSTSTATTTGSGIFAAGGGISIYTARPSWQTGSGISSTADPKDYNGNAVTLNGTPISGLHRLVPDLSLISANGHDGTLFCAGGICSISTTGTLLNAGIVGGTSVATPVMASAQALINQKNGGRQGNANYYYYQLASNQYNASTTACQAPNGTASSPTVTLPASTCNFHDIIAGDIIVPTAASPSTAGIGFRSAAGFDEASGLGSVDIANVANNWSSVTFNATSTTLSLTPTTGITHGASQTATIQVTPASGSGTPTGDVSLIVSANTATGEPQVFTLNGGSVNGTVNSLPAGTYTVYAHYAGDGTFASSNSAPVVVSIGSESSTTSTSVYQVTSAGAVNSISSFTYGSGELYLDTNIAGASGNGTPGGTVTYTVSRNGSPLSPLTVNVDTFANAYLLSGPSFANFYLTANYPTLSPGSYSVTSSYSGDTSFTASSTSTTFTVTQATPAVTFTAASAQITSGASASFNYTIATPTAATPASGTVTFTDTTTGSNLGTANLSNGAVVFNTSAILNAGTHTISAAYSGDTNYASATTTTTITVGVSTAPTVTVSTTGTLTSGASISVKATLSAAAAASTTVNFYDGSVLLGTATVSSGGTTATLASRYYTAGSHTFRATFAGNSSQSSATGSTNVTIAQNTPTIALGVPTTGNYGSVPVYAGIVRSPAPSSALATSIPVTGTVTFYDASTSPATAVGSATPVYDPSGYYYYVATATLNNLSVGSHSIYAVYSGDTNYATATSGTNTLVINKGTPSVTVNPTSLTQNAATTTVTALVTYGGVAPTGAVTISIDGGSAVAATCTGSASPRVCTASVPTASLSAGAHTATATIAADSNYNAAAGSGAVTVVASATSGAAAVMTSPTPGSALTGTTVTFNWTPGTNVGNYVLYIGSYPGGLDIFAGNPVYTTSQTISGLPTNGSTVYVRLRSLINGDYVYNDYTYTSYAATPVKAEMTSPAPGSTLTGTTVTFNWTPGTNVGNYALYIGSYPGSLDIFAGNPVYTTSQTISGLPTNGSTVYVRLRSLINGDYVYNDYTYTAYSATPVKAEMTSPAPGSTLTGTTVTFNWTPGTNVGNYALYIGSYPGGLDIFAGNPVYTTSQTISGLPTNGSTVYVRLRSLINGDYVYNDYTYTSYSATPVKAEMTSPAPGSTLTGSTVTFNWTPGTNVGNYALYIGSYPGGLDIFAGNPVYTTSQTISGLPTNGSTVYVRLRSLINGDYVYNDYTYTAATQP